MQSHYIPRWMTQNLLRATEEEPVVVLTGPRQVGKSTLLEEVLAKKGWRFVTLDNLDILEQAQKNPLGLLADPAPLIIDEVQKAPQILSAVKEVVDKERSKRRFVLSGSANLLLMKNVTESLAGRATFLHLDSFAYRELQGQKMEPMLERCFQGQLPKPKDFAVEPPAKQEIWKGFFPIPALEKKNETALRWWEGFVTSYLERDLRQLAQVDSLPDFKRLMTAVALRSGSLLNQSELGRDISLLQPTIHRYLNLLETSHLFYRLPAYAVNRTKQLIKSPKPYFADSGLAAFLAGFFAPPAEEDSFWGPLLETMVFQNLRVWCGLKTPKASLYFWRTRNNIEIDFVIEHGRKLIALEVKSAKQIQFRDAEGLRVFLKEYPQTACGMVVYLGSKLEQLDEKIFAVPLQGLI